MRESGSGGVMERLGPRRDAQGGRGTKSGRSAEAPGGNGRTAGPCVCAAEQRAAFQLRAPRAASRSWHPGARLPGGGGARGKVTFAQSACAAARWGCGEGGARLRARGEVRGGGGRPRSAQGDIRLPARRAHRVSEGTFLPPSGRGQPIEGAPLLCSPRALHAARAPQPEPVLSGASPRLRGSPSLPQDAGERSPLCRTQVRASPLAGTLSQ